MAGSVGVFSDSIITGSASSHPSPQNLLYLLFFSLGSYDASLNGKAIELGGREAMARESRTKASTTWF